MIRFACTCGTTLTVPSVLAGEQGRCPGCRRVLEAPVPAEFQEHAERRIAADPGAQARGGGERRTAAAHRLLLSSVAVDRGTRRPPRSPRAGLRVVSIVAAYAVLNEARAEACKALQNLQAVS